MSKSLDQAGLQVANFAVAKQPPTQPAMPPPPPRGDGGGGADARRQAIRHHALQCATAYAGAGLIATQGQYWQMVDVFERYIRTGEQP